jgi:lactate dehydrogenase-like 2-hydroxyacid dehydrogenase
MAERVATLGDVGANLITKLATRYSVVRFDLGEDARDVVAGVSTGGHGVTAGMLEKLPALKMTAGFGVGYDKVDIPKLRTRGILYTNTPGATDNCVADQAMALYLATIRRIVEGDRHVRSGAWLKGRMPLSHRASHRRAGILGMGRIGTTIARRCTGFDMEIGYHNRTRRAETPHRYFESLVDMARWADVLFVATPGGSGTRALVNAEVLAALGAKGIVVNIARGTIIDQAALAAALKNGTIAGAGLDVFEVEPCLPTELVGLENVVLMPHTAGGTVETWDDCEGIVMENLRRFFAGEKLLSVIPELA